MEELLQVVGNETSPETPEYQELEKVSDIVADFEEKYFPFLAQEFSSKHPPTKNPKSNP